MATDPGQPGTTITLIGQSASGKTNLLSTLLFNDNCLFDLTLGPDALIEPSRTSSREQDTVEAKDYDELRRHYADILRGRDSGLAGTNNVRRYPIKFHYKEPAARRSRFGIGGKGEPQFLSESLPFTIVDGRGGDVAPDQYLDGESEEDADARSRRQDYRIGLDDSIGMVICMPIQKKEFLTEVAGRMMDEITDAVQRKSKNPSLPPLKYISLCFTKYEALFSNEGDAAAEIASEKDDFLELVAGEKILNQFRPLLKEGLEGQTFKTRIFPVSTFGFVGGVGRPNFYEYPFAPGLLTRAVDPYSDWEDEELIGHKDHFPAPVTDGEAETMWHPFNIAPPILFALTGRETGPLVINPAELWAAEDRL